MFMFTCMTFSYVFCLGCTFRYFLFNTFLLVIISMLCSCCHYHNHVHCMGLPDMAAMIYETKWQIKLFGVTEQRRFEGGFQQFYND